MKTITPRRYWFWQTEAVYGPLKEAINDRKMAARAGSDLERGFHRQNMRYCAKKAVAECRKFMARIS